MNRQAPSVCARQRKAAVFRCASSGRQSCLASACLPACRLPTPPFQRGVLQNARAPGHAEKAIHKAGRRATQAQQ